MSSQDTLHPAPERRVDAHQHFWRYREQDYPWIDDRHGALRRDFLPDDLRPLLDQHGIDGCIAVQARHSLDETEALLTLAAQHPWIVGVVGWIDLRAPDLEQQLARWSAAEKLVGFRHQIQDEPSPSRVMQDPAFNRGVDLLQHRGRVYEVLIKDADLQAAAYFCQRHDTHHLVLDHLGKPDLALEDPVAWADRIAPWRPCPTSVANCPG